MRIALSSYAFHPSVGGIESSSMVIARELVRRGHEVTVITSTPSPHPDNFPFAVLRNPGLGETLRLLRSVDVLLQNNVSLRLGWLALVTRCPWVVIHQTWIRRVSGELALVDRLKRFLLRDAANIAISRAIGDDLGLPVEIVGNSFDNALFRQKPAIARNRDIAFPGRLVSDKGADLLIEALALLRTKDLTPTVTLIGDGPERADLVQLASEKGVADQVSFAGVQQGEALVDLLNAHRILVVPSRWKEPFGIVALEGAACGCVVLGSSGGGLPDAIGPAGCVFESGSTSSLAAELETLLTVPGRLEMFQQASPEHLRRHTPQSVVDRYLAVLDRVRR